MTGIPPSGIMVRQEVEDLDKDASALKVVPEVLDKYLQHLPEAISALVASDVLHHAVRASDNLPLLLGSRQLVIYDHYCAIYHTSANQQVVGVSFTPLDQFVPASEIRRGLDTVTTDREVVRWRESFLNALRHRKLRREGASAAHEWWFSWPYYRLRICFSESFGDPPHVSLIQQQDDVVAQ